MGASINTPRPCPEPPAVLFHGSDAELRPGDLIVPGREAGRGRGQWVWLCTSIDEARAWAAAKGQDADGRRRAHVYQVEPLGEVQTARGAFRCERARVLRQL